jgi:D-serine deaminase-like pyridoxal phosphate-dependent protein
MISSVSLPWYVASNSAEVPSPALLLYPDRIEENLRRMLRVAGGAERLRPHIKTHKLPDVLCQQLALGITRFKCATVAEAEMAARAGAPDVLLAYQPVGPNVARLLKLIQVYPRTHFSTIADDAEALRALSKAAMASGIVLDVLLDLDCGQHRTGVAPGPRAAELYRLMAELGGLRPAGLHAYDGHLHQSDPMLRAAACDAAFTPVRALREELTGAGLLVPRTVAGGTPTFPMHAARGGVECSPGTTVLWDHGYATRLPDLDFLVAATLLTRVISRPGKDLLCLDLGHKAVASENPPPRVHFPDLPEARPVAHSEEHLVVESPQAGAHPVGTCLYGVPWHICPTVALHANAVVVRDGVAAGQWEITARARALTI